MRPDIYKMDFMDSIELNGWHITRVPGGWIFENVTTMTSTFVQYHNEFQLSRTVVDRDLPL